MNVLKESALLKDSKESELFDNEPLQKEVGHLVQVVFSNYAQVRINYIFFNIFFLIGINFLYVTFFH